MKEGEEQDNPTLFEIMKKNPDMTYNEATKLQEDTRLRNEASAAVIKKAGTCVTAAIKKDRPNWKDMYENEKERIKELQVRLAEALEINESHQKFNGKIQERLTEVEEDNKKLAHQVENLKLNHVRKSGL
jgi:hypothetical protein